jgi:HAMP domain-containing protein
MRALTAHAARVAQGAYLLLGQQAFPRRPRWTSWLVARTSLRLRLTVALVSVIILLVVAMEQIVVPIERHHIERSLSDGMVAAAEWMGQVVSEGLDPDRSIELPFDLAQDESFDTAQDKLFDLEKLFGMSASLDWAKLQELSEDTRSEDITYVALVDDEGTVHFSDQIALIGETVPTPDQTEIAEDRWRDEAIWIVSTPLRRGRAGERIGTLRMGVRRARVETFLDESRTLFCLVGAIAALAGALLAQAIGGAVTAPLQRLAAGVRQIGRGDLDVQFQVHTHDELAVLARSLNHMVDGLREREWLRDMFGRFVSREVAEAIRNGQVRLEGEHRVVSVLFCDIRGFTARSERHTPEEMVALLNEYLPLVVEAAGHHEGTVNKFGGDSTLVVYGAPRKLSESAYR